MAKVTHHEGSMQLPLELKCGCYLLSILTTEPAAPARKHVTLQLCPRHSEHIGQFLKDANFEVIHDPTP